MVSCVIAVLRVQFVVFAVDMKRFFSSWFSSSAWCRMNTQRHRKQGIMGVFFFFFDYGVVFGAFGALLCVAFVPVVFGLLSRFLVV